MIRVTPYCRRVLHERLAERVDLPAPEDPLVPAATHMLQSIEVGASVFGINAGACFLLVTPRT